MISFLRSQVRADDVREPYILPRLLSFRFFPIAAFPLRLSVPSVNEWGLAFRSPDHVRSPNKAARRKFAAPQTVIVSDRRLPGAPSKRAFRLLGWLPGVERSKSAKPTFRPTPYFSTFIANKALIQFDAWASLAPRLGHPRATLGPPKGHPRATQTQSQSQSGRGSQPQNSNTRLQAGH
jgi:hypothetical protein